MSRSFVHLHTHTEFSMLDGAAKIDDVMAAVTADGQPAVGISDHGVLYGVVDFFRAASGAGVKPVLGIEAYTTPGSRFDRPPRNKNTRHHMLLFAENDEGYRNLMKVSSRAYLEGFYYKPRMDKETLGQWNEGLIAINGHLGSSIAYYLTQ